MDDTKPADNVVEPASTAPINPDPSEANALDAEIERSKGPKYTEAQQAAYNLQQNAKRAQELGIDPADVLGIKPKAPAGTPMTVEMYEELQQKTASQSALQLADASIDDPKELELTKIYLENKVKPSGNAAEDLRTARLMVNAVKHAQIAEHASSAIPAKTHVSSPGAPATQKKADEELTKEEIQTMNAFKLTKEQVLASRS